jgi:ubiquinone/menaquinone biosynthesis C-methylase UbiE
MPFSQTSQLTPIVHWVEQASPKTLLDIGIGMGQYGFLLRTKLENVNLFHIDGDKARLRSKHEWSIKIDGIEGFAEYMTPVQEWAYNNIFIADAMDCLSSLPDNSYEVLIAIDILEHFEKEDGFRLLREMKRVAAKAALISTPKEFIVQDIPANPLENHRSVWSETDLSGCGFKEIVPNDESWIAVWRA